MCAAAGAAGRLWPKPTTASSCVTRRLASSSAAMRACSLGAAARTHSCHHNPHVPTSHTRRTRSREQNRIIARRDLQLQLDDLHRGDKSVRAVAAAKARKAAARSSARSRAKHAAHAAARIAGGGAVAPLKQRRRHRPLRYVAGARWLPPVRGGTTVPPIPAGAGILKARHGAHSGWVHEP